LHGLRRREGRPGWETGGQTRRLRHSYEVARTGHARSTEGPGFRMPAAAGPGVERQHSSGDASERMHSRRQARSIRTCAKSNSSPLPHRRTLSPRSVRM
jgi:hypothetical protein